MPIATVSKTNIKTSLDWNIHRTALLKPVLDRLTSDRRVLVPAFGNKADSVTFNTWASMQDEWALPFVEVCEMYGAKDVSAIVGYQGLSETAPDFALVKKATDELPSILGWNQKVVFNVTSYGFRTNLFVKAEESTSKQSQDICDDPVWIQGLRGYSESVLRELIAKEEPLSTIVKGRANGIAFIRSIFPSAREFGFLGMMVGHGSSEHLGDEKLTDSLYREAATNIAEIFNFGLSFRIVASPMISQDFYLPNFDGPNWHTALSFVQQKELLGIEHNPTGVKRKRS